MYGPHSELFSISGPVNTLSLTCLNLVNMRKYIDLPYDMAYYVIFKFIYILYTLYIKQKNKHGVYI